jgi:hypothetical protein
LLVAETLILVFTFVAATDMLGIAAPEASATSSIIELKMDSDCAINGIANPRAARRTGRHRSSTHRNRIVM